jgi:colanic acid biosynthesis glycosyl transferase WcaI
MSLQGTGAHREVAGDDARATGATRAEGDEPRRIVVHDFAGHPFQIDLSRALAERGHTVLHVHCASYTSGKGHFAVADGVTDLSVVGLSTGGEFAKYAPVRRWVQEVAYGRRFAALADAFRPDVVLSCNVPLLAQQVSARWCARRSIPWVFWVQDLYSVAVRATAEQRAGRVGRLVGGRFEALERSLLRQARAVVPITGDFLPLMERWGVPSERCTVIENWAPLAEIPLRPRANAWRHDQGLGDRFVFLYSGTLGLKHRPELLFELAAQHVDDAEVVVISEGLGATRLRQMLAERPLPNLRLLPFQPFDRYPDILGAADVLVALLEPTAGTFSVPSKVLSYLCAGRPILGAIPPENLAARTIARAGAGSVVAPVDEEAFLLAAKRLRNEPRRRATAGAAARAYAEATFDTEQVTDRFIRVLDAAGAGGDPGRAAHPLGTAASA